MQQLNRNAAVFQRQFLFMTFIEQRTIANGSIFCRCLFYGELLIFSFMFIYSR